MESTPGPWPAQLTADWRRALDAYVEEMGALSGSRETRYGYQLIIANFLRAHPDPVVVTALDVQEWISRPSKWGRPANPQTIRSRLHPIRGFYRRAILWGLTRSNPTDGIRGPKANPPLPRGLEPDEVKRLLGVIEETNLGTREALHRSARDRAFILVAYYTGLRVSEVGGIRAASLSGALVSPGGDVYARVRCKGGKMRAVHLPPPAWEAVLDYLGVRGRSIGEMRDDEVIWGGDRGRNGYHNAVWVRALRRYGRAAGLGHVTVHTLRHAHAKLLDELGVPLREIMEALGQEHRVTTERYLARLCPRQNGHWRAIAAALKMG